MEVPWGWARLQTHPWGGWCVLRYTRSEVNTDKASSRGIWEGHAMPDRRSVGESEKERSAKEIAHDEGILKTELLQSVALICLATPR